MAVESYASRLEPENGDVAMGRFMNMHKFRDLMTTGELYFRRATCLRTRTKACRPRSTCPGFLGWTLISGLSHSFEKAFTSDCWHLFRKETHKMWAEYGKDGVAINSRYCLLESALDAIVDRALLGLVRYGPDH